MIKRGVEARDNSASQVETVQSLQKVSPTSAPKKPNTTIVKDSTGYGSGRE